MATVMFFLEFYFHDQVPLPEGMRVEEAVSYALVPLFLAAAGSSVAAGKVSAADRLAKNRNLPTKAFLHIPVAPPAERLLGRTATCVCVGVCHGHGGGVRGDGLDAAFLRHFGHCVSLRYGVRPRGSPPPWWEGHTQG